MFFTIFIFIAQEGDFTIFNPAYKALTGSLGIEPSLRTSPEIWIA